MAEDDGRDDWRPRPDPTILTTAQLQREIDTVRRDHAQLRIDIQREIDIRIAHEISARASALANSDKGSNNLLNILSLGVSIVAVIVAVFTLVERSSALH